MTANSSASTQQLNKRRAQLQHAHDQSRQRWKVRWQAWSALILGLMPVIILLIAHRLWLRRRAVVGLAAKLTGVPPSPLPTGRVIIHGVSLGEVALMKAVIPTCAQPPILTTSTETGWAGLEKSYPHLPRAYWPFDLPWAVQAFLRHTRPAAVVLLEAELWPLMIAACHARGIPVILANARASERSTARLDAVRVISAPLLRNLHLVAAQTAVYAARFRRLGVPPERLRITGSLKADLVQPTAPTGWCHAHGLAVESPLLLLASTSAPEEAALLVGGLEAWFQRGWQVAICPRHPERGDELAKLIVRLRGLPRRTSLREKIGARYNDVLIIDEIGRLGSLYAHTAASAGIAVVGGSCGSGRGGQNMLEAAAVGCCTVVGWDTRAQPDPMALLRAHNGVCELQLGRIGPALAELAADMVGRRARGRRAHAAWASGRGALAKLDRHLRWCLSALVRAD